MKIGFFIPNTKFHNVDCRFVDKGNPGIGGTWHVFLIVASQLAKRDNGLDVTVFVQDVNDNLPEGPSYIVSDSPESSVQKADSLNLDYLVLNLNQFDWDHYNYSNITSNLKLIVWCHNFCDRHLLRFFYKCDRIFKIINVGREQMDLYRDHPAFTKMEYIYNCVPFDQLNYQKVLEFPFSKRNHVVTFVGSLVPSKSFHVLAKIWKKILNEVSDAELYVIGSGALYDRSQKLGKYNIAESSYEESFMSYLVDEKSCILPSVHFLGSIGLEKNEILLKTKVGVPNPTGNTETFCLSAVEMQLMGCTVVAMSAPGYYDTFVNGCISIDENELKNDIVRQLYADISILPYDYAYKQLISQFSILSVVRDWEQLFYQTDSKNHIHSLTPIYNASYRHKYLKEILRKIKSFVNYSIPIPEIELFYVAKKKINKMMSWK